MTEANKLHSKTVDVKFPITEYEWEMVVLFFMFVHIYELSTNLRRNYMNVQSKKVFSIPLVAGLTYAIIWLAIGALVLSLLLQFTDLRESALAIVSYIIHGFATLVGGITAGKRTEAKGWYQGSTLGIFYSIIVMLTSFLASDVSPSWDSFMQLGIMVGSGALGGMVGVNLKK